MEPTARSSGAAWVAALAGLGAGGLGLWLVVSLPSSDQLVAGWRHEVLSSTLGAIAIFAGCWSQGRRLLQPVHAYALAGVALALVALALPVARLPGLIALSAAMIVAGLYVLAIELRRPRPWPPAATVAVLVGTIDLASVGPMFAILSANGVLQPPL